mmetsp:Transcript_11307/g.11342  ORF Transcript_11307/g.11342 Transcript_11307/m.11342 type:complete len:149 (-) Transcript_11307:408-854(-)
MLVKRYSEKSIEVRRETTKVFQQLLKIFRIREFVEFLLPYLNYPHYNIKQEMVNLLLYSFILSKGSASFDCVSVIKQLAVLLEDRNIKVRFIAMETLSYLTTLESKKKILKVAQKQLFTNHIAYEALERRLEVQPNVKLNQENEIEYQ